MCRKRNFMIPALLLMAGTVFGQNEENGVVDSIINAPDLKEVVVSTVRAKSKIDEVPQKIKVLSSEDIKQTGARDLTQVLKKNAGVDVIEYPGMLSGIGIRGYRPQFSGLNQRTLILVDGHLAGATNLGTIDLEDIEQIEVLKGAASSLYGSQAMGGVVNIITKKNKGAIKKSLYGSFGSYSSLSLGMNAGGAINDKLNFDFSIKHFQQNENFRIGQDNFFRKALAGEETTLTYYNSEHDIDSVKRVKDVAGDGEKREFTKYAFQSGRLRFGYQIHKNWAANISGNFLSANNVQAPGDIFYGNSAQSIKNPNRYGADLTLEGKIGKNHTLTLRGFTSVENSDYRSASGGVLSDFVTSKRTNKWAGYQVQDNIKLKDHNVVVGVDQNNLQTSSKSYRSDNGNQKGPYSPNYGIYSSAIFAQAFLNFMNNKFHFNGGIRLDNIVFDVQETPMLETYTMGKESYGVINPNIGLRHDFFKNLNVHATFGEAFVTPDAYNVAGYSVSGPGATDNVKGKVNITYGNPELRPEKGLTLDGGVGYKNIRNGLKFDFTLFNILVKDRITRGQTKVLDELEVTVDGDTIVSKTTYINADKSRMNGLEADFSWDIGAFANYSYSFEIFANAVKYFTLENEFRNTSFPAKDVFSKSKIHNVANFSANFGINFSKDRLNGRISGRYVGSRFDIDWSDYIKTPEVEYNPYMTMDVSLGFEASKKSMVEIQVNNLTDENYYEKRGFNLQGRNLNIKYTYNF